MGILEMLGLKRLINAYGTVTLIGGSRPNEEVLKAMAEISKVFVSMEELYRKVGEIIAKETGAEAAIVTSGAAAGVTLSVAACMTGGDLKRAYQLPNTTGLKDEIVVQRKHKSIYIYVAQIPGAKLVYVGNEQRTLPSEIESAINDKTAAILYMYFDPQEGVVPLDKVIEIAHRKGVPVIVDAAAELPPVDNLRKFVKMGADLVVFSGGKDIGGPNDTGIVLGRKDLIDAIFKLGPHSLDVVDGQLTCFIGRPMKLSKEDIVGLLVAFLRYIKMDHEARLRKLHEMVDKVVNELSSIPCVKVSKYLPDSSHPVRPLIIPKAEFDLSNCVLNADELLELLKKKDPPVIAYSAHGKVYVNPQCLTDDELEIVIERFKEVFSEKCKNCPKKRK